VDGLLHRIRWDNVARLVAVLAVVAFAVVWLRSGEDRPSVPSSVPRPVTGAAPAVLPGADTSPNATAAVPMSASPTEMVRRRVTRIGDRR